MTQPAQHPNIWRFGVFEADLRAGELRRNGHRVPLQQQPFQLLAILLEQRGEVVTKEELAERLWPDVTVDVPGGIGAALHSLRRALDDNAKKPRYIETIQQKGYRFIATAVPVERAPTPQPEPPTPVEQEQESAEQKEDPPPPPWPDWMRWAAYGAAVLGLLLAGYWIGTILGRGQPEKREVRRFSISPQGRLVQTTGPGRMLHISPDGRRLAYVTYPPSGRDGLRAQLWLHDLRTAQARRAEGVEYPKSPFWSLNSETLFFGVQSPTVALYRMPAEGGPAIKVSDVPGLYRTASISDEGTVYLHGGSPGRAWQVSANGGEVTPVLADAELQKIFADGNAPETDVGSVPLALPSASGRRGLIFGVHTDRSLFVLDLENREIRELFSGVKEVVWSPTGHLLYVDQFNDLWAVPFSLEHLAVSGDPFRIEHRVVNPTVADDGTLAFFEFTSAPPKLVWRDRQGKLVEAIGSGEEARISLDESRVAFSAGDPHRTSIEVRSLTGGPQVRVAQGRFEIMPVWSADGKRVAFTSNRGVDANIYVKTVDSDEEPVPLLAAPGRDFPDDASADGRFLIFSRNERFAKNGLSKDLYFAERQPKTGDWTAKVLRQTEFSESGARFSPDGRYYAYMSTETGQPEIVVREFPSGPKRWIISRGKRPRNPVWSKKSGEVFYVTDGSLFSVEVSTQPEFSAGEPVRLFPVGGSTLNDVTADGRRFLFADPPADPHKPLIWVVQNWYEKFRDAETE